MFMFETQRLIELLRSSLVQKECQQDLTIQSELNLLLLDIAVKHMLMIKQKLLIGLADFLDTLVTVEKNGGR